MTNTPADEVAARLKDADVVFTNRERIGEGGVCRRAEFAISRPVCNRLR
jgi:hypothetical protein